MLKVLEILDSWIDEIPLAEQQQRFGNKAFRDWHLRLEQVIIIFFEFGRNSYLRSLNYRRRYLNIPYDLIFIFRIANTYSKMH